MFPACFTQDAAIACRVSLFVSNGEFANMLSIAFTTRGASSGESSFTVYQPIWPLSAAGRCSSRYLY